MGGFRGRGARSCVAGTGRASGCEVSATYEEEPFGQQALGLRDPG